MDKIYYDLKHANKLISQIRPLLKKIIKYNKQLIVLSETTIQYEDEFQDFYQSTKESKAWHKLHYNFFDKLQKLAELGILVKDPAIGLIDLYSIYQDREIFLCYRFPENEIQFWHEIDAGYSGRQSVKLLEEQN